MSNKHAHLIFATARTITAQKTLFFLISCSCTRRLNCFCSFLVFVCCLLLSHSCGESSIYIFLGMLLLNSCFFLALYIHFIIIDLILHTTFFSPCAFIIIVVINFFCTSCFLCFLKFFFVFLLVWSSFWRVCQDEFDFYALCDGGGKWSKEVREDAEVFWLEIRTSVL